MPVTGCTIYPSAKPGVEVCCSTSRKKNEGITTVAQDQIYRWARAGAGWEIRPGGDASIARAARMCLEQAERMAGGDPEVLHEIGKVQVPSFSGSGSGDGVSDLDMLNHYCEELKLVLDATDVPHEGWVEAGDLLKRSGRGD
jgi:hypothetical protein